MKQRDVTRYGGESRARHQCGERIALRQGTHGDARTADEGIRDDRFLPGGFLIHSSDATAPPTPADTASPVPMAPVGGEVLKSMPIRTHDSHNVTITRTARVIPAIFRTRR